MKKACDSLGRACFDRFYLQILLVLLFLPMLYACKTDAKQTANAEIDTTGKTEETIVADTAVPHPAKSQTALYLDSLGLVCISEADSSIAVDLSTPVPTTLLAKYFTKICTKPTCTPTP